MAAPADSWGQVQVLTEYLVINQVTFKLYTAQMNTMFHMSRQDFGQIFVYRKIFLHSKVTIMYLGDLLIL
jgi:hypothetical protein